MDTKQEPYKGYIITDTEKVGLRSPGLPNGMQKCTTKLVKGPTNAELNHIVMAMDEFTFYANMDKVDSFEKALKMAVDNFIKKSVIREE